MSQAGRWACCGVGIGLAIVRGSTAHAGPVKAVPTSAFLDSMGIVTTMPDRGQPIERTAEMVRYCGFRWVRGGTEGLTEKGPTTLQTYLDLHKATGAKLNWGMVSGGTDIPRLLATARVLAQADALLAFEGNNEPNNWGVTYQGEKGGGNAPSWLAVAKLHRDLYAAVKADPVLAKYPVWSTTETGAERDNVGLQFLTIPEGTNALMPAGTRYADLANCHNYFYHPNSPTPKDNQTWNAADPSPACRVDGLFGNFGKTWAGHFAGHSQAELDTLPRVTTETGCTIGGEITEEIQAKNFLTLYLDQYKRGWSYTSAYLLRDREDEGGNQSFGLFKKDYSPRKAAAYLHNLTTILKGDGAAKEPGALDHELAGATETVHELLLQRGDGAFQLVVWDERVKGEDRVTVKFGVEQAGVTIFDPTIGTNGTKVNGAVRSVELVLSDHPLVIEVLAR